MKKIVRSLPLLITLLLSLSGKTQTNPTGVYEPHTFKYHYFPGYVRIGTSLLLDLKDTTNHKLLSNGIQFFNGKPHYYSFSAGRWYTFLNTTDTIGLGGGVGGGENFGEADTLLTAARYVNQNGNLFNYKNGTVSFDNTDSVGVRFSHSWATNPLGGNWTDVTPSATVTTDGSKTSFTGGALNMSNHIDLSYYTGTENWTVTFRAVIKSKSGTSYGLSFAMIPSVLPGSYCQTAFFALSDTAGYINYIQSNTNIASVLASNRGLQTFKWAVNDTMSFEVKRRQGWIYIEMINDATGQKSTLSYRGDYQGAISVGAVSTLSLFTQGLDFDLVGTFRHIINEPKYPKFMFGGNSTVIGFGATDIPYRSADIAMEGQQGQYVIMAGSGEQTSHALTRLPEIRTVFKPKYYVYEYGINDRLNSVTAATFGANTRTFIQALVDSGIVPIIKTVIPLSSADVTEYNDTLTAIATQYSAILINSNYPLRATSGTGPNTAYYKSDGIHPNDKGYKIDGDVAKKAISSLTKSLPGISIGRFPVQQRPKYLAGIDDDNNLVGVHPGVLNDYIRNIPLYENDGSTLNNDIQMASIFINGNYVNNGGRYMIHVGSGSISNPNFRVDGSTGITTIGSISTQNMTNGGGATTFGSGNIIMQTTAQLVPISIPLTVVRSTPGSGTAASMVVNNNQTGGQPSASYKLQLWQENSVDKAWIDRAGGIHADSVSGYTKNLVGLYTARSWVDRNYVDSILAAVSGLTNPLTSTGDIIYSSDNSGTPARLGVGTNNQVLTLVDGLPSWEDASAGSGIALSAITAASGTNSINNGSSRQNWRWESLGGDTALAINATTTAAASDAQVGFASLLKGANSTSGQFTSAIVAENTHTGTTSENVGLYASSSGGTYNYDAWFANNKVSFGGASVAAGATDATGAVQGSYVRMTDNSWGGTTYFVNANYATKLSIGAKGLFTNQDFEFTAVGGDAYWNVTRNNFGTNANGHSTLQTSGSFAVKYTATATGITLDATHSVINVTATGQTITLPTAVSISGRQYTIKLTASGSCTIATTSSQTIDGSTTYSLSAQYKYVTVVSDGANWIITANN